ncbi:porin [Taylorella asinigenitalis]|uniref:porin n=1 Tax=Taylorella asinigenitalis TaxID=84590 RepID=UPI0004916DEF|nr:porin [Taylorella asinigenitalis]
MKKTLLVAALLAGFAGAVEAKTSVTLYGRIDAGIGYSQETIRSTSAQGSNTNTSIGAIVNGQSSSRWGLKGSEDLGNGLSAIFQIESGFDSVLGTNKSGQLFNRKAILGLKGGFGTLTVGLQNNIADDLISQGMDWGNADAGEAHGALSYRLKDLPTVKFLSNDNNGLVFGIQGGYSRTGKKVDSGSSNGVNTNTYDSSSYMGIGIGYKKNKLSFGITFDSLQTRDKEAVGTDANGNVKYEVAKTNAKALTVGGGYDFGAVELFLGYGRQWDGFFGGKALGVTHAVQQPGGKEVEPISNMWFAGISAPVGDASKVHVKYWGGNATPDDNAQNNYTIMGHGFALGFEHKLSKRTNVYVQGTYMYTRSDVEGARSDSASEFKVGLRHRF